MNLILVKSRNRKFDSSFISLKSISITKGIQKSRSFGAIKLYVPRETNSISPEKLAKQKYQKEKFRLSVKLVR